MGALARIGRAIALLTGLTGPVATATAAAPLLRVEVRDGDTARGLAETHLRDPDLWPQILVLSGLASVLDLQPGVVVLIPVAQVRAADAALDVSLAAIQKATAHGARLFAPVQIGQAIELRETAVSFRKEGNWDATKDNSDRSTAFAVEALEVSLKARDQSAEAVLSDVKGSVEGRRPTDPRWEVRKLQDLLVEFERLRTLSASTAMVTFTDLSRLRLNANSNAVIQRMRRDPLTGEDKTRVSLIEGDFYALLNGLSERSAFEVVIPGVETEVRSADFWVGRDDEGVRFANYDDAEFNVTTRGETISLKRNEGAVVPAGPGAAVKVDVLAEVALVAPADGFQVFTGEARLEWSAVPEAAGYWLEVAADVDFGRMTVSRWGIAATDEALAELAVGAYFWRVSAIDGLGLPGARSLARRIEVLKDATPPFLAVRSPAEGEIVRTEPVRIAGEADPESRLEIDGRYVALDGGGAFAAEVSLAPGSHEIVLVATDRAGNVTRRTLGVTYRPDRAASLVLDPAIPRDAAGRLLSQAASLAVSGTSTAEPGSRLSLRDASGILVAETLIEAGGGFRLAVPAGAVPASFSLAVTAVSGATEAEAAFVVLRDEVPPPIAFPVPPPSSTRERWVELAGSAGDAVTLTLNGAPVVLTGGRFAITLPLRPGANDAELVATDRVGNVAVQRLRIVSDLEPPVLGAAELRRDRGPAGQVEFRLAATDASGLRQTAAFQIALDGGVQNGFLQFDTQFSGYRASLPPVPGRTLVILVTVEDYPGNRISVRFTCALTGRGSCRSEGQ